MNTTNLKNQDFISYAMLKCCEEFKISSITANQFKCLIFACGLRSSSDIRTKFLNLIDKKPDNLISIENLSTECIVTGKRRIRCINH